MVAADDSLIQSTKTAIVGPGAPTTERRRTPAVAVGGPQKTALASGPPPPGCQGRSVAESAAALVVAVSQCGCRTRRWSPSPQIGSG